jgi:hypothetical protein
MKFRKVVSFGCSWTYGDELFDPKVPDHLEHWQRLERSEKHREHFCYTGIIGRHFRAKHIINLGDPGSSQKSARNWFTRYVTEEDVSDTLFLIGLTERNRYSWIRNDIDVPENFRYDNHMHSTWIRDETTKNNSSWQDKLKLHYALEHSHYFEEMEHIKSALYYDGFAARNNIALVQFNLFGKVFKGSIGNTPTYLYPNSSMQDFLNKEGGCYAPGTHPNEKGHRKIADILIPEIERLYEI